MSLTSQSTSRSRAQLLGERPHALLDRFALVGERQLGALLGQARLAIPQASDRSFARPMISPRLPCHQSGQMRLPLFPFRRDVLAGLRLFDLKLVGVRPGIDFAL